MKVERLGIFPKDLQGHFHVNTVKVPRKFFLTFFPFPNFPIFLFIYLRLPNPPYQLNGAEASMPSRHRRRAGHLRAAMGNYYRDNGL